MIILRQREFGSSYYNSQSGREESFGKDFFWHNGKRQGVNIDLARPINDQVLGKSGTGQYKRRLRKLQKNGIYVGGNKENHRIAISFNEGLSNGKRGIVHSFQSTKDPVSAYRDFLRAHNERMNAGDIFGEFKTTLTNKDIKNAIRKNARKQTIISKARKAAPWTLAGTAAIGTGAALYKNYKNKKNDNLTTI